MQLEINYANIGQRIKTARLEKGINQRQLGLAAGIPATTISGWINANRMPDYYALIKLSQFFEVPADLLLGLIDEGGKPIGVGRKKA